MVRIRPGVTPVTTCCLMRIDQRCFVDPTITVWKEVNLTALILRRIAAAVALAASSPRAVIV